MKTTVVNSRREHYDVYIGRGGQWGNPFLIGRDGTREEVIEKYRVWILGQPGLLRQLPMLKGKRLGCFCAPHPCHGDVLVAMVDADLGAIWLEIARLRRFEIAYHGLGIDPKQIMDALLRMFDDEQAQGHGYERVK